MSALLNGADCGPSNPLKSVSGRLDADRSIYQDRLVSRPTQAGSSKQPFRSSPAPAQARQQSSPAASPFDLASLRSHLEPKTAQPPQSGWAQSFVSSPPVPSVAQAGPSLGKGKQRAGSSQVNPWHNEFHEYISRSTSQPNLAPWQRTQQPQASPSYQPNLSATRPLPHPYNHYPQPVYTPPPLHHYAQREQPVIQDQRNAAVSREPLNDAQEILASTAQSLVQDLRNSDGILRDNPKLAQSKFFSLIDAIGQKEVVVKDAPLSHSEEVGEGAQLVPRGAQDWASDFTSPSTSQRDTGQHASSSSAVRDAAMPGWADQFAMIGNQAGPSVQTMQRRKSVHFSEDLHDERAVSAVEVHEPFDTDTFNDFNGQMRSASTPRLGVGSFEAWGEMQDSLNDLFRTQGGSSLRGQNVGGVERYLFQRGNPYTSGVVDTEVFGQENQTVKGVLELEAEVQANPTDHLAWHALGLKQQENEREDQAILALAKAIQLEPDHRPSYLALAVSYTNEGDQAGANVMLDKWLDLDSTDSSQLGRRDGESLAEERGRLIERLIEVARQNPEHLDPEVQIALGVLFNSSEEYEKAEDCFLAALSVRPDDWLLYNRLGATLANSGRSNEAITYYHKALSLHPTFVRALFNLGIAHMNLNEYSSAAQRVLDALRLQYSDTTQAFSSSARGAGSIKGITSDILWTTLRNACMHMGRSELVEAALQRDLSAFPSTMEVAGDPSTVATA